MSSPAPTSRTQAKATSETTSALRIQPRPWPSVEPRLGFLQRVVERGGGNVKGGRESEDQAGQHGHDEYEGERGGIGADVVEQRNADRFQAGERARSGEGEDESEQRAAAGEHQALGQHLADQAAPSRAQRHADGDFLLAGGGARQQQIREIRADDQHDHADGEGEHGQRRADASADVLGERRDVAFKVVALRMGAR